MSREIVAADSSRTKLMNAVLDNDVEAVKALLIAAKPEELNEVARSRYTALMLAAEKGNKEIVGALLEKEEINLGMECGGHTASMIAAFYGHTDIVMQLISKEKDPDKASDIACRALVDAVQGGCVETVTELLTINGVKEKIDEVVVGGGPALLKFAKKAEHKEVTDLLEVNKIGANNAILETAKQEHPAKIVKAPFLGKAVIAAVRVASAIGAVGRVIFGKEIADFCGYAGRLLFGKGEKDAAIFGSANEKTPSANGSSGQARAVPKSLDLTKLGEPKIHDGGKLTAQELAKQFAMTPSGGHLEGLTVAGPTRNGGNPDAAVACGGPRATGGSKARR